MTNSGFRSMKKAVFFVKKGGFRGLEGETAERALKQIICDADDKSLDFFKIDSGRQLTLNDVRKYHGYDVLIFIYGKVFITREGLNILAEVAIDRKDLSAIAPISNLAKVSLQMQSPPFFYQTITGYKWAARAIHQEFKNLVIETERIDDLCLVFRRVALDTLPKKTPIVDLPDVVNNEGLKIGIAKGVYAHAYGDCYESGREDLMAHIPLDSIDVLDVGCANGLFGAMVKKRQRCMVTGVECDIDLAETAKTRLDNVISGSIDDMIDSGILGRYDCIVCGDVLEHLSDPWKVIKGLRRHLKPQGIFIASVPNIANWGIIYEMLRGRWDYVPFTILSGTHLRFFTRDSIKESFQDAGYEIRELYFQSFGIPPEGSEFIYSLKQTLPYVNEEELKASEIVIVAERGSC